MGFQLSRKIFATLMSAVLVLALVPAFACAQLQVALADEAPVPGPAIKNNNGCVLPSNVPDRRYVVKITFTNEITQDESITPEDVSENGDGSVMAWAIETESDSNEYEVFYASDGKYPSFPADSSRFFKYFALLESIDGIDNVSAANVTNMSEIFAYCSLIKGLDLSNFDTSKVTNMSGMFEGCAELRKLDLTSFDTANVTDMSYMFDECTRLNQLNVSSFNTSKVTDMSDMFANARVIAQLDLSSFDTSSVASMRRMFTGCLKLSQLDLSSFNTSKVTNMVQMFSRCTLLDNINLSNFDTSNVTNMESMFNQCSSLNALDLSSFCGDSLENTISMFWNCDSLKYIDLSHLNTPVLIDAGGMFVSCLKLESVNIASFDTQALATCEAMFGYCVNLENIYASDKFKLSSTCTSEDMFFAADKLIGENGTTYDSENEDGTYARIDAGDDAPGYFKLAKVTSAKLSANSFEYDGKTKTPKVEAKCGDFVLSEGTDYTVAYPAKAKKIGKYSLTVNGAGSYSSTVAPVKANFKIIPRSCKLKSVKASTKALKVKWKKKAKAHPSGYQIKIATNKKFTTGKKSVKVKNYKISSKKITKLKKNKKYYVKIRAYKVVDGKTYYSAWSKVKTKKTK